MTDKIDHLRLCNEHKIPFQDFERQFCSRCFQRECTRSQHGKSKFEERVGSWEQRLFTNVDRMAPSDPRFGELSAKKFLPVVPGAAHAQSAWMDPKDIEPLTVISIPEEPKPEVRVIDLPPLPVTPLPEENSSPVSKPLETPDLVKFQPPVQRNTPARPRQMIGGAEPKPSAPVLDPWQPVQGLKPGEQLIQPGARIKFGK